RYPLGNSLASAGAIGLINRSGAGSPSKEYGSRLFSKRAREIQAQEGVSPQIWGPPTSGSGHSTPLRETIPESPSSDSFPDFDQSATDLSEAPAAGRRMRAAVIVTKDFPSDAFYQPPSGQHRYTSRVEHSDSLCHQLFSEIAAFSPESGFYAPAPRSSQQYTWRLWTAVLFQWVDFRPRKSIHTTEHPLLRWSLVSCTFLA
ncbi:hypothetical protein KCU78_g24254, partial [Aureobasidium melanogenum]